MKAVTFETWDELNTFLENGWDYVDCKIIETGKKLEFLVILVESDRNKSIIINRSRR